jgi:hypothetical protein
VHVAAVDEERVLLTAAIAFTNRGAVAS